MNLTKNTDMAVVVRAMAQPDSGLEVRDRMWLKINIPNSFIGWFPANVIKIAVFCSVFAY